MTKNDDNNTVEQDLRSHGEKIRDRLIEKYGPDYYSTLGKVGGKRSDNRPFRDNPGAAKRAVQERWRRYRLAQKEAKALEIE